MTSVVAAQAAAAATIMRSPRSWCGSAAGVGAPKAMTMPANDSSEPDPLHRAEAVAGKQPVRADHHQERREIDEQHRARRRGVEQPAIDQQELEAEQRTGDEARP